MKVRKLLRLVAVVAMVGGMIFQSMPAAHAGTTGTITDSANDVIDFLKHPQNSFRPSTSPFPGVYTSYQRACQSGSLAVVADCKPLDLATSSLTTNPTAQTITFTSTMQGNIPPHGSPITAFPAPFTGMIYNWYFNTTAQERADVIGISCTGVADPDNVIRTQHAVAGTTSGSKIGAEITYTGTTTCPAAANANDEAKGNNTAGNRNVLSRTDVKSPARPAGDGWMAVVDVRSVVASNGSPRLDGQGNLVCQGGAALCLDYDISVGRYEGYSGVTVSNSRKDFDEDTRPKMTLSIVGKQVSVTVPWNPTTIAGTDRDLVLDDRRSFPFPFAVPGKNDKVTNLVAGVHGVASVGVNTVTAIGAVCPDSTDNVVPESDQPIRTVGALEGSVNRQIGNTTNQVLDQAGIGNQGGPKDDGIYLHGDGSTEHGDCIRGITGLLTLLDWQGDGSELRIYPRNPGYLPSASGVDCRYPIGERPLSVVLLSSVVLGPMTAPTVDLSTSPYDRPWKVNVYANGTTPAHSVNGPVLPNPVPTPLNPLGGAIGKDKPCGYIFWTPGIHYYDILAADVPFQV